jgi:hypothetical protein
VEAALTVPEKRGWLLKRGGKLGTVWQRRWFHMRGQLLY